MRLSVLALVLAAGCASAPIRQADLARLATADARVSDGCYTCLIEARTIYEAIAVGRARGPVVPRLFETTLLIALRQAELGQDATAEFTRAAALAGELPATADAGFLVDLARRMPPDALGTPRALAREATLQRREFVKSQVPTAATRIGASTLSADLRAYLTASVTCLATSSGVSLGTKPPAEIPATLSPLVRYRMGTCPLVRAEILDAVSAEVPAFVEAGYFSARMPSLRMTSELVRRQRAAFTAAAATFPDSPSIAYSLGALNQTVGDCRAATPHYDRTLELAPRHEDAALQRVICLGYLGRHENAINATTRLIDEKYDNADEALYWRAWNRHRLRQLPEARADVDAALLVSASARTLTLGGIIKYEQKDLVLAERDLARAVTMDRTQCVARWYLGLVAFERELWVSTGDDFAAAAACYQRSAEETEAQLAIVRNADLDADFKASQIAGFQAVIQEDRSQEQASYLNAANGFVRAANYDRARQMLAGISADSVHAAGAAEIRRYLEEIGAGQSR